MKVLCVAYVEDRTLLDEQILKQTIQPDRTIIVVDENPAKEMADRRKRIAENQTKLQEIVEAYKEYDFVWQLEGDGVLPENALEKLIEDFKQYPDAGYITGSEIGRHGLYHIGAWVNFTDTSFESINHHLKGVQPIDASGFYCLLAKREAFLSGKASWNGEPYGPDVVWGLSIRYTKYIDLDLEIGHKVKNGIIYPHHISTCTVRFEKGDKWAYKTKE